MDMFSVGVGQSIAKAKKGHTLRNALIAFGILGFIAVGVPVLLALWN